MIEHKPITDWYQWKWSRSTLLLRIESFFIDRTRQDRLFACFWCKKEEKEKSRRRCVIVVPLNQTLFYCVFVSHFYIFGEIK